MMVKICGITNLDDALAAVEGGATALGFNFWPRSARYVSPDDAHHIIRELPSTVWKVGVFVDEERGAVADIARAVRLDVVQLHGRETAREFPDSLRVWKAVRVAKDFDPAALAAYPAEAVLLDGPENGVAFDWKIGARSPKKVIIAGGLDATNVRQAIEQAHPWGVDACSRLESAPGRKDQDRMARFLEAALGK